MAPIHHDRVHREVVAGLIYRFRPATRNPHYTGDPDKPAQVPDPDSSFVALVLSEPSIIKDKHASLDGVVRQQHQITVLVLEVEVGPDADRRWDVGSTMQVNLPGSWTVEYPIPNEIVRNAYSILTKVGRATKRRSTP